MPAAQFRLPPSVPEGTKKSRRLETPAAWCAIAHCQLQTFPPVKIPKIEKVVVGSVVTGCIVHDRYLSQTISPSGARIKGRDAKNEDTKIYPF
jgi:hypothetical protein